MSELFDETVLVVPVRPRPSHGGEQPLAGRNLRVCPLTPVCGSALRRKLATPLWLLRNAPSILREAWKADGIHAPIPGDVGTFGMLLALGLRKPLFVRHCGNWTAPRTAAERFWKWMMERFAGERNVMFATGGGSSAPSANTSIGWIFATSLSMKDFEAAPKTYTPGSPVRLVIACRQQRPKGTAEAIRALPLLLRSCPEATLDVAGDGDALPELRALADSLNLSGKVRFHGKLPHRAVLDLLAQSTLFCYPTFASEGFPKAVLEALASGLPVVTTRVSVLPQLISRGCGQLLDDTSPESISRAVLDCLEPSRYRVLSEQAIATARQYSLERWRDSIGDKLRTSWGPLSEKVV